MHCWTRPVQECSEPLMYAHRVGLETGDNEFALVRSRRTDPKHLAKLVFELIISQTSVALLFLLVSKGLWITIVLIQI